MQFCTEYFLEFRFPHDWNKKKRKQNKTIWSDGILFFSRKKNKQNKRRSSPRKWKMSFNNNNNKFFFLSEIQASDTHVERENKKKTNHRLWILLKSYFAAMKNYYQSQRRLQRSFFKTSPPSSQPLPSPFALSSSRSHHRVKSINHCLLLI